VLSEYGSERFTARSGLYKARVKDSSLFIEEDNTSTNNYWRWKAKCLIKLVINVSLWHNEWKQILYVYGLTDKTAYDIIKLRVNIIITDSYLSLNAL